MAVNKPAAGIAPRRYWSRTRHTALRRGLSRPGRSSLSGGSLIGVFLGALAVGYALGGLAADAWPHRPLLGVPIAAAGAWVLATPRLAEAAAGLADLGPRLGPLMAAAVLFFMPTMLLGMVSPWAMRIQGAAPGRLGRAAGRLYAISTLGSIAGTLATAFFLVPAVGVASLIQAMGAALVALGGGWMALARWQQPQVRGLGWGGLVLAGAARVEDARRLGVREDVLALVGHLYRRPLDLAGAPVLTDDHAPVEHVLTSGTSGRR